jgi:uracil-DNA glycosylase
MVPKYDPGESNILIVGYGPDEDDIKNEMPFSHTKGRVLRTEIQRAGLILDYCAMTNLWLHKPEKGNPEHYEWHLAQLFTELDYAEFVMMIGSELPKIFIDKSITEVSGLTLHSAKAGKYITFAPTLNSPLYGTVGEFRMAAKRFGERVRGI